MARTRAGRTQSRGASKSPAATHAGTAHARSFRDKGPRQTEEASRQGHRREPNERDRERERKRLTAVRTPCSRRRTSRLARGTALPNRETTHSSAWAHGGRGKHPTALSDHIHERVAYRGQTTTTTETQTGRKTAAADTRETRPAQVQVVQAERRGNRDKKLTLDEVVRERRAWRLHVAHPAHHLSQQDRDKSTQNVSCRRHEGEKRQPASAGRYQDTTSKKPTRRSGARQQDRVARSHGQSARCKRAALHSRSTTHLAAQGEPELLALAANCRRKLCANKTAKIC